MPEEKKHRISGPELVSEEIEEIIGQPPGWLVRYGVMVFVGILVMFLVGSAFFIYPNKVTAPVVITTQNPPLPMNARVTGRIDDLHVKDRQHVRRGALLAVLENPSDYHEVLALKQWLDHLPDNFFEELTDTLLFPDYTHLGPVQPYYADLLQACEDYRHFMALGYHRKRLEELKKELRKYRVYYNRLYRNRNLAEKELMLMEKQYRRDSVLYVKKVLSEADYELSVAEWLRKNQSFEQARIRLSEATIRMSGIEQSILSTEAEYQNQKKEKSLVVSKALKNLYSSIDDWMKKYLLMAPVAGEVSFTEYWAPHQYVREGKTVMTIVPDTTGKWMGRMKIPMNRSGEVKKGLPVNIRLKNFPYLQYGMIRGRVSSISQVPEKNSYFIDIDLPEGLVTLYGKKLPYRQQMEGTGEILTEKRSLLKRLTDPLRYLSDKYLKD